MDTTILQNSKCYYCCIYCDENKKCECVCYGIEKWKNEKIIASECVHAYEDDEETDWCDIN